MLESLCKRNLNWNLHLLGLRGYKGENNYFLCSIMETTNVFIDESFVPLYVVLNIFVEQVSTSLWDPETDGHLEMIRMQMLLFSRMNKFDIRATHDDKRMDIYQSSQTLANEKKCVRGLPKLMVRPKVSVRDAWLVSKLALLTSPWTLSLLANLLTSCIWFWYDLLKLKVYICGKNMSLC